MIRDAKYRRFGRYLQFFAEQLYSVTCEQFPHVNALVPVPLHRERLWERTFNQAERLADHLYQISGIPVLSCLVKTKKTIPQSSLSGGSRRRNLKGVFAWEGSGVVPKSALLLDDVITTGATLEHCAKTLRRAGVRSVYGLTVARAVKK